jgi:hypothetical protein
MRIVVSCPVYQYCGIEHLTTTGTSPGIKGTDEIIECLGKHTTLTSWTMHNLILPFCDIRYIKSFMSSCIFNRCATYAILRKTPWQLKQKSALNQTVKSTFLERYIFYHLSLRLITDPPASTCRH